MNRRLRSNKFVAIIAIFSLLFLLPTAVNAQNQEIIMVGEVCVFSEPESGAEVYIDGKFVGKTPLIKKIEVGKHDFVVKKETFYDYHDSFVVGRSRTDVKVKMEPKFGMMMINTKPVGAKVFLNGMEYPLTTPCLSCKISAGTLKVTVELEEYHSVDTTVVIEEGKIENLNLKLEKQPFFEIMSKSNYNTQLQNIDNKGNNTTGSQNLNTIKPKNSKKKLDITAYSVGKSEIVSSFGFKGGLGLSHVWGKDENGERIRWSTGDYYSVYPTFYFGVQYAARFNRFIAVSADLNFSRTGYQYVYLNFDIQYGVISKFTFNGLELPVVARVYFLENGLGPNIELGAIVNYRKQYKVKYTNSDDIVLTEKNDYKAFNWGLVGGIGWDFMLVDVNCSANARAVMEFSNVFGDVNHRLFYFQFGVGVKIF